MLDLKEQALEFVFSSNLSWNPGLLAVERQPLIYFCKGISVDLKRQEEISEEAPTVGNPVAGQQTRDCYHNYHSRKEVAVGGDTWLNGSVARGKKVWPVM